VILSPLELIFFNLFYQAIIVNLLSSLVIF
jgi:hypothetical protein